MSAIAQFAKQAHAIKVFGRVYAQVGDFVATPIEGATKRIGASAIVFISIILPAYGRKWLNPATKILSQFKIDFLIRIAAVHIVGKLTQVLG